MICLLAGIIRSRQLGENMRMKFKNIIVHKYHKTSPIKTIIRIRTINAKADSLFNYRSCEKKYKLEYRAALQLFIFYCSAEKEKVV